MAGNKAQGNREHPLEPKYRVTSKFTHAQLSNATIEVNIIGHGRTIPSLRAGNPDAEGKMVLVLNFSFSTGRPLEQVGHLQRLTQSKTDAIVEHADPKIARFKLTIPIRVE